MKKLLCFLLPIGLLLPEASLADMVCNYNAAGCLVSRVTQSNQAKSVAEESAFVNTMVLPCPYIDDKVTIETDLVDTGVAVECVICDFNGYVWHSGHIELAVTEIPTNLFPAGTYILMMTNGEEQVSYKLIKR